MPHPSDVSNQRKFRFITTLVDMARYIFYLPVLRCRTTRLLIVATCGLLITVLLGSAAGSFLVVNDPKPSDVIVVLAGDHDQQRYQRALGLLAGGFGRLMMVDARADNAEFGQTSASLAERFVQTTAGGLANRVRVCPVRGDSTQGEARWVGKCLLGIQSSRVLLVTSDFHTRRAMETFRRRLPDHEWSAAASHNQYDFGEKWWQQREWAKTTLMEYTKLMWWELVDRWR